MKKEFQPYGAYDFATGTSQLKGNAIKHLAAPYPWLQ